MWHNGVPSKIQTFLLCYQDAESVSHLLVHCHFSREVWSGIMRDFGISLVFPIDLMTLLSGWRTTALSVLSKRL